VHRFIGSGSWSCVRWHLAQEGFAGMVLDEDMIDDVARQNCSLMNLIKSKCRCLFF
jgi:hypothetical protein